METSQHPLAIESFSYSWLSNRKFSLDGLNIEPLRTSLDVCNEASSEETKHKMVTPAKSFPENSHNLNFDFPIPEFPPSLVHADEIFSHGHILPMYRGDQSNSSVPSIPASSIPSRTVCPADRIIIHFQLLRKWRKSSKRVLKKYLLGFLRPFSRKVGFPRKVWEVRSWNNSPQASPPPPPSPQTSTFCVDIDRGSVWKAKSRSNSPLSSPPRSPPCSGGDWGVESSIYEAILHCKRSFEKCEDLLDSGGKENGRLRLDSF